MKDIKWKWGKQYVKKIPCLKKGGVAKQGGGERDQIKTP